MIFPNNHDIGGDLVARNIQRGRDHGIPGFCCYYNRHVDKFFNCNNGWDKKYEGISENNWNLLQTIYKKPSDIDIFTGGLAQEPHNGGVTGQVFQKMKRKISALSTELMSKVTDHCTSVKGEIPLKSVIFLHIFCTVSSEL